MCAKAAKREPVERTHWEGCEAAHPECAQEKARMLEAKHTDWEAVARRFANAILNENGYISQSTFNLALRIKALPRERK